ncbi:probable transcriptional regulatory protein At2g25830 isoform X1 [Actinidia eriantha]|uniref:probable transcriptional regulatory protein At2g25830 isoform X1 n=1 Tax=Actinidia eriantha TaxID=165200 RepID=UPI00259010E3|nr:probable transcriptional regulatory protein At2g25830 isoform X1 [Actinidia eriantha]
MASSTIRAFGASLYRFSNGFSIKYPNSIALHSTSKGLLRKNLSCSSSCSPYLWVQSFELQSLNSNRKIWTFSPLCMGRRSCKIAGRKGAQDAKKAKLYSKIGKEVVSAVKRGGPNPVSNMALAAVIEKVKELDVPKDILDRNMKKASEKGQEAYIEKFYEVYGFGGVGIIVEVLTDKITRSVAAVRGVVKDCGGKLADPGSIMFKFTRARVVNVKVTDADRDQLLAIALDAGADDIIEPPMYEDDTDEDRSERYYKVVSSSENYAAILAKLREEGITFEPDNGFELLPITPIEVDDEAEDLNKELMSKLLELDDVDAVYTDQK